MAQTLSKLDIRPLTTALGAEIFGVDISCPLDDATFTAIRQALHDHLVIFFRDQKLDPAQLKAFASRFGPLNVHPFVDPMAEHEEILEVKKDVNDTRNFGGLWHSDLTFLERPPMGSVLYAVEVPKAGGDTMFANMYQAYETLSDGMRKMIDPLIAIHSAVQVYGVAGATGMPGSSMQTQQTEAADGEVEHPLVRTHPETGRRSLFVSLPYTRRIKGMTVEESAPLLNYLARHAVTPEFTCRFRWEKGSVAFWDNRCTKHFALNDYHGQRRVMHRVTVEGDRPV